MDDIARFLPFSANLTQAETGRRREGEQMSSCCWCGSQGSAQQPQAAE